MQHKSGGGISEELKPPLKHRALKTPAATASLLFFLPFFILKPVSQKCHFKALTAPYKMAIPAPLKTRSPYLEEKLLDVSKQRLSLIRLLRNNHCKTSQPKKKKNQKKHETTKPTSLPTLPQKKPQAPKMPESSKLSVLHCPGAGTLLTQPGLIKDSHKH